MASETTTSSMTVAQAVKPGPSAGLLSGAILPTLLRLAVPNMIAMLAMALVAVAETSYVGLLGTPALAGMALVFPLVMLQQMMSGGAMGSAISSAISRAIGSGDQQRAHDLTLHATVIGAAGGLLLTGIVLYFGRSIYGFLGGRGEILTQALAYSDTVFLGAAGVWLFNTSSSVLRGSGDMRTPMITALAVSVAQVALGGALGLGLWSFPKLGMQGIALGQVIAYAFGALFLLVYLARRSRRSRSATRGTGLKAVIFADILKVGLMACIAPVQSVATVLILTWLVARLGTEALAGYGIGSRLEFMLIPVAFAIGSASVPMVGMAMGARNVGRARQVAWTAGGLAAGLLGVVGVVVWFAPDVWTSLFSGEPRVRAAAASYFAWAGPSYAFFGLGLCLFFASQGAGKVVGPVLAGTLRLIIVAVGGWWLAAIQAPAWMMFALISLAMLAFGLAAALAVKLVSWDPKGPSQGRDDKGRDRTSRT